MTKKVEVKTVDKKGKWTLAMWSQPREKAGYFPFAFRFIDTGTYKKVLADYYNNGGTR